MADIDINSSQESLVDSFIGITGVERERAVFFLQSAAWNLDAAVGAFYDDSATDQSSVTVKDSSLQVEPTSSELSSISQPVQPRGGIATLSDYAEKPGSPPGKDAQQFFAGGSEHSGQMIEGPPRKKDPDTIAKEVFEAAKKHGAVSVSVEESEKQKQKSAAFHGTGFRLGDVEGPGQAIGNQRPLPPKPEVIRHVLTFWKNGFSVDDGPMRNGDTDEDHKFIDAVRKGEIPQELMRVAKGGEVDVDIRDRRDEMYVKPKPKVVAFSGEGRKLGSYAPEVKTATPTSSAEASSTVTPPPSVPLDPTLPTTSIQIRLADGTRLVSKFNHSHTVNDVRQFINMSRPTSAHYVLMTTFPNRELTDPTLTLTQANLLNAVIVQRIR